MGTILAEGGCPPVAELLVVGHRVWAIAEGYIAGHGFSQKHELVSNEAACIHTRLNARDPHIALLSMIAFPVKT